MKTLNLFLLFFFLITNYSLANQCECEVMECIKASRVVDSSEISKEIEVMKKRVAILEKEAILKQENMEELANTTTPEIEYLNSEISYYNTMIELKKANKQVYRLEEALGYQEPNFKAIINQEIKLEGFLAKKSGDHLVRGRFLQYMIVLEKPVCIMFAKYRRKLESDGFKTTGIYALSHVVTHIQVHFLDSYLHNKAADSINDQVSLVGVLFPQGTSWHLTPFVMEAAKMKKINMEWSKD